MFSIYNLNSIFKYKNFAIEIADTQHHQCVNGEAGKPNVPVSRPKAKYHEDHEDIDGDCKERHGDSKYYKVQSRTPVLRLLLLCSNN